MNMPEPSGDEYDGMCLAGKRSGQRRYDSAAEQSLYKVEFFHGMYHAQSRVSTPGYAYENAFTLGKKHSLCKDNLLDKRTI